MPTCFASTTSCLQLNKPAQEQGRHVPWRTDVNLTRNAYDKRPHTDSLEHRQTRTEADSSHRGAEQVSRTPDVADVVRQILPGGSIPHSEGKAVIQRRITYRTNDSHGNKTQHESGQ